MHNSNGNEKRYVPVDPSDLRYAMFSNVMDPHAASSISAPAHPPFLCPPPSLRSKRSPTPPLSPTSRPADSKTAGLILSGTGADCPDSSDSESFTFQSVDEQQCEDETNTSAFKIVYGYGAGDALEDTGLDDAHAPLTGTVRDAKRLQSMPILNLDLDSLNGTMTRRLMRKTSIAFSMPVPVNMGLLVSPNNPYQRAPRRID
jgi:hypothetical protein